MAGLFERAGMSVVLVTNDVDEAILLADRIVPLSLGPGASLGPSFRVALERPRRRERLNRDPAFVKLRNEVPTYLLELAARRAEQAPPRKLTEPPALEPIDLTRRGLRVLR
jgi:nitrate/nitrite transport system ATP-binding protein